MSTAATTKSSTPQWTVEDQRELDGILLKKKPTDSETKRMNQLLAQKKAAKLAKRASQGDKDSLPSIIWAEAAGTFILILIGCSVAIQATLKLPIAGAPLGSLGVALAFGATLAVIAYKFNADFNPGVSIAKAVSGDRSIGETLVRIATQIIAAVSAGRALLYVWGDQAYKADLATTRPAAGVDGLRATLIEMFFMYLLASVVIFMGSKRAEKFSMLAGLIASITLTISILAIGPLTGGAINFARAFGPMVWTGDFTGFWVYAAASFGAGILGGISGRIGKKKDQEAAS